MANRLGLLSGGTRRSDPTRGGDIFGLAASAGRAGAGYPGDLPAGAGRTAQGIGGAIGIRKNSD